MDSGVGYILISRPVYTMIR